MKLAISLIFAMFIFVNLLSIIPPELSDKCKTKGYSKGDEIVISIDGRNAVVNSVYCNSLEVVYFNGERYCYETFNAEFVEKSTSLIDSIAK